MNTQTYISVRLQALGVFLGVLLLSLPQVSLGVITNDLRSGSKGVQVSELQTILIAKGFLTGESTGTYGPKTVAAVKAFQKKNALAQTGTVGRQTRVLLNIFATMAVPTPTPVFEKKPAASVEPKPVTVQAAKPVAPFTFSPAWKDAVVNLFCTDRNGGGIVSGSGIIIDPRGVILTNAHVAIDHLFAEWPKTSLSDCVVRTGGPAYPRYRARILYIPDPYVTEAVASQYRPQQEMATTYGDHDYALLYITGPISDSIKMPAAFPYIPLSTEQTPKSGDSVFLVGYGASFLGYEAMLSSLYQIASSSTVSARAAIGKRTTADVMLFNGNLAAQHGSSGGAVIAHDGAIAGMPTFYAKENGITTADKVLGAISTSYILSQFQADTGMTLSQYLDGDLAQKAADYLAGDVQRYVLMFARQWKAKNALVPGVEWDKVE